MHRLHKILVLSTICSTLSTQLIADQSSSNMHKKEHPKNAGHSSHNQENNPNIFINASYTFWVPYNDATIYDTGFGTGGTIGNDLVARNNAVSGFQVGLGANTQYDMWHVGVKYTWFYHDPSSKANTVLPNVQYTKTNNGATDLSSATSRYKVQFNRIDGILCKSILIGDHIEMSPWLGILGGWDTQKLSYTVTLPDQSTSVRVSQDWWGIGPYAGAKGTYFFHKHFGLFISSGVSLLLVERDGTYYSNLVATETENNQLLQNKGSYYDEEVMLEACLGAIWKKSYEKVGFHILIAWDAQIYLQHFFQPQFISGPAGAYSNYAMQGLTINAGICF